MFLLRLEEVINLMAKIIGKKVHFALSSLPMFSGVFFCRTKLGAITQETGQCEKTLGMTYDWVDKALLACSSINVAAPSITHSAQTSLGIY